MSHPAARKSRKFRHSRWLLVAIFAAFSMLSVFLAPSALSTASIEHVFLSLHGVASEHRGLAIAAFVLGYALMIGLAAFVPSSPISLLGGMLFGPLLGGAAGLAAKTLGGLLSFWFWGKIVATGEKDAGSPIRKISDRIRADGFWYLLMLRLLPILPFGLVTFAASLARIRLPHFVVATLFGQIPAVFLYAYAGHGAARLLLDGGIGKMTVETSVQMLAAPISLLTVLGLAGLVLRAGLNALGSDSWRASCP